MMFYIEDSFEVVFFKGNFLNFVLKLYYRFRFVEVYVVLFLIKKVVEVIKNIIIGKWGEYYVVLFIICDIEKS